MSFYARGDGSTANNAALNVENLSQQRTTGDLVLDYNGGANDPDTTFIINGISYDFKVELTGGLPFANGKVPDPLEGKQITVISTIINGSYERFFFATDGSGTLSLMNQFGNGAISLTNANFAPPPVLICFCAGTQILTPEGLRAVDDLRIGDTVKSAAGKSMPILWIDRTEVSRDELRTNPAKAPICIPASSIVPNVPFDDLYVSPQHRVVLESPLAELIFGEPRVLVPAKHLVGIMAHETRPDGAVSYYHLLLAEHEMVFANGLTTESLQISTQFYSGLPDATQTSLFDAISGDGLKTYFRRPDSLPSLKMHESKTLIFAMFGNTPPQRQSGIKAVGSKDMLRSA